MSLITINCQSFYCLLMPWNLGKFALNMLQLYFTGFKVQKQVKNHFNIDLFIDFFTNFFQLPECWMCLISIILGIHFLGIRVGYVPLSGCAERSQSLDSCLLLHISIRSRSYEALEPWFFSSESLDFFLIFPIFSLDFMA